jgi:hypothetical protein
LRLRDPTEEVTEEEETEAKSENLVGSEDASPPTEKIKPNKPRVSSDEPTKNEKMRTTTASQKRRHVSTDTKDRVQVRQNLRTMIGTRGIGGWRQEQTKMETKEKRREIR